jgi:hypothetical protein
MSRRRWSSRLMRSWCASERKCRPPYRALFRSSLRTAGLSLPVPHRTRRLVVEVARVMRRDIASAHAHLNLRLSYVHLPGPIRFSNENLGGCRTIRSIGGETVQM